MDINKILKQQLKKISLGKNEEKELWNIANNFVREMNNNGLRASIGGSLAKGTLIKKKVQDIDVFVLFDKQDFEKLDDFLDKSKYKLKKLHGSRDYYQIMLENIILELIPVIEIKKADEAKNITDVSLMHVNYVKKKINKNKKLSDEIKLAKSFCFANDVYGAESYIQGFSGYALEVLVIAFGGFLKFIKGIKKKRFIDAEKQFKNEKQARKELNESKLTSPLLVIDPTYKYRNVAAGLSEKTFDKFLNSVNCFLKKPSLNWFEKKEINIKEIEKEAKKKKAQLIKLKLKTDRQEGDIAGTKMKKLFNFIINNLERKEQVVLKSEFEYSGEKEAMGYLVVKEKNEIEIKGPEKTMKEAVKKFRNIRKNRGDNVFEKGNCFYARERVDLKDIFAGLHRFEEEMGCWFEVL